MSTLRVGLSVLAVAFFLSLASCDSGGSNMPEAEVPQEWRGIWDVVKTETENADVSVFTAPDFWEIEAQRVDAFTLTRGNFCESSSLDLVEIDGNRATYEYEFEGEAQEVEYRIEVTESKMTVTLIRHTARDGLEGVRVFFEKTDGPLLGCEQ